MPQEGYKRKSLQRDLPRTFPKKTLDTICRIDDIQNVLGVLYLENGLIKISTVPESVSAALVPTLPVFTDAIRKAITEIDVLDELIAYRIESKSVEILVVPAEHCAAVAVQKSRRKLKHSKHTRISANVYK